MTARHRGGDPAAYLRAMRRHCLRIAALLDAVPNPAADEAVAGEIPRRAIADLRSAARSLHRETDQLLTVLDARRSSDDGN